MSKPRSVRALMLLLALAVPAAVVVVGANPVAAAPAAPAAPAAATHSTYSNGCTLSPDSSNYPVYYNFHSACDRHDLCYHYKPYGFSSAGRLACDNVFHSNMRSWCVGNYSVFRIAQRYVCYGVALTYYTAVRNLGWPFFVLA